MAGALSADFGCGISGLSQIPLSSGPTAEDRPLNGEADISAIATEDPTQEGDLAPLRGRPACHLSSVHFAGIWLRRDSAEPRPVGGPWTKHPPVQDKADFRRPPLSGSGRSALSAPPVVCIPERSEPPNTSSARSSSHQTASHRQLAGRRADRGAAARVTRVLDGGGPDQALAPATAPALYLARLRGTLKPPASGFRGSGSNWTDPAMGDVAQ